MQKQARKSKRVCLFSENEKKFLKGKKSYDRKMKHEFFKNLDLRFDELLKDLALMNKSKSINSWKAFRRWRFSAWFNQDMIRQAFDNTQRIYVERMKSVTKGKGKSKRHFFWLDEKPLSDNKIDDRAFNSKFLFRGMRNLDNVWFETSGKILLKAYHNQGILPNKKDDRITLDEIKKRLTGKSKIRTNIKQIRNINKDIFKDSRNFEIKNIIDKHIKRSFKLLNKKLKKYDSEIKRYLVDPSYHPESE